ncbi:hypothetical protein PANT_2c00069 [Moesziomyces antarcticus T-34]|uniref:Vacuolar sorting protein Vps3844 C-terminal domain-containing protein n=1 Tax=Pseudozyma antarctica (strain T-34) TaxID=1151754 RepID=M9LSR6_PSEA3|nr:hypothetical protein PANT_2c00069 [Moesziomyces antarcticus T-34]
MVRISATSLASLACFASAAVTGASAKTSLYLSPATTPDAQVDIDANQAHRILSHHMHVEQHAHDDASYRDAKDVWQMLDIGTAHAKIDNRAGVERLFDGHKDEPNRLLVLMHGTAHQDVIPASVGATHSIEGAPSSTSFDALFDSYLGTVSNTLKSSESAFSHLAGTFLDGFTASIDWLTSHADTAATRWSHHAAAFGSDAFAKLEHELRAVEALVAKMQATRANDSADELSMQPLRFSALGDVEATYGTDSVELARAKQLVREAIERVTALFQARSEEHGRVPWIAFVVTDADTEQRLVKRSSSDLLAPFLGARTSELSHGAALRPGDVLASTAKKSKPSPLPKNLAGTCFGSQSDLDKATNGCSGHGKGVKSSKGGRACWRCKCQPTEVRKGKKTYWAGAACEKKDVSAEFMLLASSVVLLVLISAGSVYFLFAQGSQELPGTLASVTISLK